MVQTHSGQIPGKVRGSYVVALAVLAAGLVLTAFVFRVTLSSETKADQARFTQYADEVNSAVSARFSQYLAVLDSSAGLFAGSNTVRRADWQGFAEAISLPETYPGVSSLQYLTFVPREQLSHFIAGARADGAPAFTLTPAGERPFYCPITYGAPAGISSYVEGFDPCHAEANLSVLVEARDTGRTTLSAPLDLRDANDVQHRGVVAVRALYRSGAERSTPAGRRAALRGWVAETLPMDKVIKGLMPAGVSLDVDIHDAEMMGPAGVIYRSDPGREDTRPWWIDLIGTQANYTTTMTLGGRSWVLNFFEPPSVAWMALILGLAGLLVTIPVSLLVLNLGLSGSRAQRLADKMTESLREQEQLLSSITNNISDGIYRATPEKGLVYVNGALARIFGYSSSEELMSVPGPILYVNPRRRQELQQLLEEQGQYHDEEVEYRRKDGAPFYGLNSAVTVLDADGKPLYFDGVISDITERKRAEEQVYQLAHYDSLTGLPNRTLLRDRLGQAMSDARRRGARLAVLFLDLDRFKTVNDSLGHEIGDKLLKSVAFRLIESMRDSDTISRQGGDEFLLIVRDITDASGVARVAEKVLEAVARPYAVGEHELHITPSIGISLFPDDADDIDALIRNADAAMYHAKESGRFNFQFFTREMNAHAHERLALESSLRQAIERREFSLHYQPQIDLRTGRIMGMEALLRWNRPGHETVPPSVFVPVLEASGMIGAVGDWVLREACRQNREWQQRGLPELPVAVNLSAIQFNRRNMADAIAGILTETGLNPEYLELEFTESAVMQDTRETGAIIQRLDRLGVQLSIDDFGTGYSSLSYLRRFHLDKIKIDQSFVRDIGVDPDDAAIITTIIGLARNLRVMVVAEGVETREQYEFLRSHGCDGMQGYYFSRPLPAQEFAELLARDPRLKADSS